ncbi:MAG: hypothetical protein KAG61_06855 [Bacteriovoracaceae bacterium]|nr:hypothetical protein [Bacteriovoracaceae bacterium]
MNEFPSLPDYEEIEDYLEAERLALVKSSFAEEEEDDELVRSVEDAKLIYQVVKNIQTDLWNNLHEYPTLLQKFSKDHTSLPIFFERDYIVEICFISDFLFPDKELLEFSEEGSVSMELLLDHQKYLHHWVREIVGHHNETQVLLHESFDQEIRRSELKCQCYTCVADYRTKLRDSIYKECLQYIEEAKDELEENVESDIFTASGIFHDMQKNIDRLLRSIRTRLKRGTLNKLETQVKAKIKTHFLFPSELANKYAESVLTPFFRKQLRSEGINPELINIDELSRFYKQLSRNFWRNDRYLEREFKKLVKSVLLLKRKDISATILMDYLGEFWIHSTARKMNRKIIYHMGPTNSGKTYHAINALCEAKNGCYLAPLRLLAGELYDTMNSKGAKTTLLTGEEVIEVEDATHYSSTIEMARFQEYFDCCVIDEIQMITDSQRGWAWTRALVNINADEVHICGDPSALDLVEQIVELCGDSLEIRNYERMTELNVESTPAVVGDLQKNDAVIVFSRKKALKYKNDLERCGFKVSIVYGRLSPEVRREQARKFDEGETDIIVSTDAIAMGMNLPIKRIVFTTVTKHFDGQAFDITDSEIKQIAGRAGRYLRFPVGTVTCLSRVEEGIEKISNALNAQLPQKEECMIGPDLDIFAMVNSALKTNSVPELKLSEFLRLFNTMTFKDPFECVELKEMIEIAEMVEDADRNSNLSNSEIFGFACAPVNLGMMEHVEYFSWILNHYVVDQPIHNEPIDHESRDIDYLETKIKCVELYQWLSRHFDNKNFDFDDLALHDNKSLAIAKLNELLSDKILPTCSSCAAPLPENSRFAICENCFKQRRYGRSGRPSGRSTGSRKTHKPANLKEKDNRSGGDKKNDSSSRPSNKKSPASKGRGRSRKSTRRFD